jgi:mRNA interferase MazF
MNQTLRDTRKFRVFVIVSRQLLIDSRFSTVVCAPIYTAYDGLTTQVPAGSAEGLKHDSSIHCDEPVSLPKSLQTGFIGLLPLEKMKLLDKALKAALQLHSD